MVKVKFVIIDTVNEKSIQVNWTIWIWIKYIYIF